MNPIVNFAIVTVLTTSVVYLGYISLLRNEPGFRFNRIFLISGLLGAHLVALTVWFPDLIPVQTEKSMNANTLYSIILQPIVVSNNGITATESSSFPLLIYLTGMLLFAFRLLIRFLSFFRIRRLSEPSIYHTSIRWTKGNISPFSFLNTMYLPLNMKDNEDLEEIIRHEQVHIKNKHGVDLLFVQLLGIIFWFNPFVILFEKLLRENHEFEADKRVIESGILPEKYTHILLGQNKILSSIMIGNNFNYNILKRRLKMFYKKNSPFTVFKAAIAVPAVAGLMIVLAISCSRNPSDVGVPPPPPPPPPPPVEASTQTNAEVYTVVEEMPEFPGGENARIQYFGKNVKYPETAISKNVQGTVYLSFIVEKDGSISDTKIIRGISPDCDMEALRVVNQMPKWKPGKQKGENVRVLFNLPLSFKLMDDQKKGLIKSGN
jgi:TonB family protein